MVSFEYEAVAVAQIDNHVILPVADARPTSHEVPDRFSGNQIRQPVLEKLCHSVAQFMLCLGLFLANRSKRHGFKG
jgi:hypothetical protein